MTPVPRIRFHDVLGTAVQRSDGTWQLIPHGVTRSWTVTDVWIMANPGWRELTVVEEPRLGD